MQIVWDDKYSVGIAELDEQHKFLLNLINQLDAIHSSPKTSVYEEQIDTVLEQIKHYTVLHFTTEEVLMRMFDYFYFDVHKFAHDRFVHILLEHHKYILELLEKRYTLREGKVGNKTTLEEEEVEQEVNARVTKVIIFLQKWVVNHILKDDKEYSEFFIKIQKKANGSGGMFSFFKD